MNAATIPTNRGALTAEQIVDELTYGSYSANRGYGMTPERLATFFGDSKVEAMERRYRLEHAVAEEGAAVWPKGVEAPAPALERRCIDCGAGGVLAFRCSRCEAQYQREQQEYRL